MCFGAIDVMCVFHGLYFTWVSCIPLSKEVIDDSLFISNSYCVTVPTEQSDLAEARSIVVVVSVYSFVLGTFGFEGTILLPDFLATFTIATRSNTGDSHLSTRG